MNSTQRLAYEAMMTAVYAYATNDMATIEEMGFMPSEVREIGELSLLDVARHLMRAPAHFIRTEVDHACARRMLEHTRSESELSRVQDELIQVGATPTFFRERWGWSRHEFTRRQRALGIEPPLGRPRTLLPGEAEVAWESWHRNAAFGDDPKRYLAAARESGAPLASLLPEIEEWMRLEWEEYQQQQHRRENAARFGTC